MSYAILYDAHHQRHLEDLPFWLELAIGLDLDADMLAVLQEKSRLTRHTAPLIRADMAAFHFSFRFSLIILPCNTLSTLRETARSAMLELVAHHLAPGGIFAASIPNPHLLASLPQQVDPEIEESFIHPLDGLPVQVSNAWEHNGKLFTLHWHYDHQRTDGSQERFSATSYQNLIPASQYIAEFEATGLTILHQYGDFKRRPFTRRAHDLILVARKSM